MHCFVISAFQLGDTLPSIEVVEGVPPVKVNIKDIFAGKKGILFAVPGAFTPGCSKVSIEVLAFLNVSSECNLHYLGGPILYL